MGPCECLATSLSLDCACRSVNLWLRIKQDAIQNCFLLLTPCVNVCAHGTIFSRYSKHHSKTTENNGSLTGDDIFIYDKELENRKGEKSCLL